MNAPDPGTGPAADRFATLWADYLEGDLDGEGLAELDALLAADPAQLAAAADLYEEHRLLSVALRPFDGPAFTRAVQRQVSEGESRFAGAIAERIGAVCRDRSVDADALNLPPPRRRRRWPGGAAAAAFLAVIGIAVAVHLRRDEPPAPESRPQHVATFVRGDACRVGADGATAKPGARLPVGPLALAEGVAVVRFDGGAAVVLDGRSGLVELNLESPAAASLLRGAVSVRAEEEAAGFVLHTRASDVVDLGTEFAVKVGPSGRTEVQVLEGEVELSDVPATEPRSSGGRVLGAGHAVQVTPASDGGRAASVREMPVSADRFATLLQAAPPAQKQRGRLLAADSFLGTAGPTSGEAKGAAGGVGWSGPWGVDWPNSDRPFLVAPEGLTGPPGFAGFAGGRIEASTRLEEGGGRALKRRFANPIDAGTRQTVFLSILVRRERPMALRQGGFRVHLVGPGGLGDRIGFGALSDGRPIVYGPAGNISTGSPVGAGTHLFVFELVAREDRPDRLRLKVIRPGEAVPPDEPLSWTVTGRPADFDMKLDAVHITDGVRIRTGWSFDEIRLGTTWQSVTSGPVPADAAASGPTRSNDE